MKDVGTIVYVSERGIDEAIKRFKKRVEKFGILDEFKKRQYYEKPSVARHKAKKSHPKNK